MPRFARHGYSRGPQYFLAEEMLGWVSRGWSEGRTRPADLTPRKACGRSRKKEKEEGPFRRAPSRLKLQQRAKKRQRASPCGGGRRAEPGLRTSRHLCPEGVKRARGRLCPAGVQAATKEKEQGSFRRIAFCSSPKRSPRGLPKPPKTPCLVGLYALFSCASLLFVL